ncbi:MAG TPA: neutral zinc metallopeptidase [Bryobacteraceae bacterium]|nr:neutral zinc metallopeptidase [Bryobacteraceae bacterium]
MEWTPGDVSSDIEDRRGISGGGGFGGGGFGGFHLGVGGTILLFILSFVFKVNLFSLFSGGPVGEPPSAAVADPARDAAEKTEVQFVSFVLDDVQRIWTLLLPQQSQAQYRHAKLVLFRDSIDSACGEAQSATGPFYCPGDEKVYLDLGFFDELSRRFGAPGDFARAYVIAHEVGHHVQKILGIEAKARRLQSGGNANAVSVKIELQADCFAGVWANSTEQRSVIDQSDVKSALQAAAAVGDDRLQKMATGHVSPETFTHGSSADRMKWFQAGLTSGQISSCDTFGQR